MKILKVFRKKLRLKKYSERTISTYLHYLKIFLLEENIKDSYQITLNDVVHFLENRSYSSTSEQSQFIGSLKLFSKYILGKKDVHLNKIERPRKEKKLPRVIEKEFLLEKIGKIKNLKHQAILSLAYSTGMRVSEVINLKIEDIDSKRELIYVKNAKGRKDRVVPLSDKILNLLRNYFIKYKPEEFLFNGQNKKQYSSTSCNKLVKKYIGPDYHFHLLRHSCFTSMLESGVDLRIIQSIAGHNSSKTTEVYTHVSNNLLSKVTLPI